MKRPPSQRPGRRHESLLPPAEAFRLEIEHEDMLERFRIRRGWTAEEFDRWVDVYRREFSLDFANPLIAYLIRFTEISGQYATEWGETIVLVPNLKLRAIQEKGTRGFDNVLIAGDVLDRFIRPITRWDRKEWGPPPGVEGGKPTHLLIVAQDEMVQNYVLHLEPDDIRPIGS
jgi:hypothetical protein